MVKANGKKTFKRFFYKYFGTDAGSIGFNIANYVFLILFALVMLYPFLYVLDTSFKAHTVVDGTLRVIYNFSAYNVILRNIAVLRAFGMSFLTVGISTVLHLLFTMLGAYPLSRRKMKGRVGILLFIVFTMLFSGGLIPYYILINSLNLRDNILVYVVTGLINGYNIIIAKNFLQGIPDSLEESARIDGANELVILFRIFIPLSLPIIATIGLWYSVGQWNDWRTGVLFIRRKELWVIQNYLRYILVSGANNYGGGDSEVMNMAESVKMAAVVVGTLPIIMIYPFIQKYFVKGVMLGSVKG